MGDTVDPYSALRDRTKAYASRLIKLYAHLQHVYRFDDAAVVLGKPLLRSATSVVANYREAKHARSRADRIAKFHIILQELEESALWLELLQEHHMAHADGLEQLLTETSELTAIFIASLHKLEQPNTAMCERSNA